MYISAHHGLGECFSIPAASAQRKNTPDQIQYIEVSNVRRGSSGGRLTTSFSVAGKMSDEKKQRFIKRFIDPMLKHDLGRKVLVALNRGPFQIGIACGNGQFGFNGTIALDRPQAVGGRGSAAIIFIDEKASDWRGFETIVAHPDVGLFHELVHALHIQTGVAVNDEEEAERRVIGIGSYLKCPVTENAYRNARDLPLRCCRGREQL
jgi:hypothetical protein